MSAEAALLRGAIDDFGLSVRNVTRLIQVLDGLAWHFGTVTCCRVVQEDKEWVVLVNGHPVMRTPDWRTAEVLAEVLEHYDDILALIEYAETLSGTAAELQNEAERLVRQLKFLAPLAVLARLKRAGRSVSKSWKDHYQAIHDVIRIIRRLRDLVET